MTLPAEMRKFKKTLWDKGLGFANSNYFLQLCNH
jgi:hypothetical protein